MTEPTSISSKPGIKCFPASAGMHDTFLYDIANTALEKFRKLKDEEILLTGESTQCICNHHVEQHSTRDHYDRTINRHCHGSDDAL